jgi:hypothetical protein
MKAYQIIYLLTASLLLGVTACNHNKIPCPTYADSAPQHHKKVKPGSQKPGMPPPTKTKSGVLPPGYGKKKH